MLKKSLLMICLILGLTLSAKLFAQGLNLSYYFPQEVKTFNSTVPSPKTFLGWEIGERLLTFDQSLAYSRLLAEKSPRVKIIEHGYGYERNPVFVIIISSEENIRNLEQIRQTHLQIADPAKSSSLSLKDMPLINWMAYSVHGNEATGINGSMLVSYALAAGEDKFIKDILDNNVVIIQPAQNPDGIQRFAFWINSNLSFGRNGDPLTREYREPAPSGRSNHYWFDLNRDWLIAQHPDSYYRLDLFYDWLPNMVNDYHEQGRRTGTFFSPGEPGSTNFLIPENNWSVTEKISKYHGRFLDRIGSPYFTREGYDDYYSGKGACMPDFTGAIGILYEQPNPAGMWRDHGGILVSMARQIRNAVYCSFSALTAGVDMREELLQYQKDFYVNRSNMAQKAAIKGYVFGDKYDRSLNEEFIRILLSHKLKVYRLNKDLSLNGKDYGAGNSFVVPLDQQNATIARTMFETALTYKDTVFYDITTWTLPLGFNIRYDELTATTGLMGEDITALYKDRIYTIEDRPLGKQATAIPVTPYAYLFEPDDYYSYKFMNYLQENGVILYSSNTPFTKVVDDIKREFRAGTIFISLGYQPFDANRLKDIINGFNKSIYGNNPKIVLATKDFKEDDHSGDIGGVVALYSVTNAFSPEFDLGGGRFERITLPKIAILIGTGTNYGVAGEAWHQLDHRFKIKATMLDVSLLEAANLNDYNVIIATGTFPLSATLKAKLTDWSRSNTLIAIGGASRLTNELGLTDINTASARAQGIILNGKLNTNSPLSYGFNTNEVAMFKNGSSYTTAAINSASLALSYTDKPLLSGYLHKGGDAVYTGKTSVLAGNGVVYFTDDPLFRAYWFGGSRMFMNAIFYRELIPRVKVATEKSTDDNPSPDENLYIQ